MRRFIAAKQCVSRGCTRLVRPAGTGTTRKFNLRASKRTFLVMCGLAVSQTRRTFLSTPDKAAFKVARIHIMLSSVLHAVFATRRCRLGAVAAPAVPLFESHLPLLSKNCGNRGCKELSVDINATYVQKALLRRLSFMGILPLNPLSIRPFGLEPPKHMEVSSKLTTTAAPPAQTCSRCLICCQNRQTCCRKKSPYLKPKRGTPGAL